MRRYFLEQIQQGEDCLSHGKLPLLVALSIENQHFTGDIDNGVDHLATAVAVCSQPQSLISLFQQTLPSEIFQELLIRLPKIAQVPSRTSFSLIVFLLF